MKELSRAPSINMDRDQYLELEKIALGAFSPLSGFMSKIEFDSVVKSMRLPTGDVFTLPVILDIDESNAKEIQLSKNVDLIYDGEIVGRIYPTDFFKCDRSDVARQVYGTDDLRHPGVRNFFNLKPVFVGGRVELINRIQSDISSYELTPLQTKKIFEERGWRRIVGFQTRNVPHRAHEYLLRIALEYSDGLFIQPLVGRKRTGDYSPEAIMMGYRALIGKYIPEGRVLLGVLSTQMRYAGPREAIFHAIVRRNYGCTHFIVGRDHAGVDNWYGLYEAHELTKKFDGDLGIEIMRLKGPFYCVKCDSIATENTCAHAYTEFAQNISGTYMRGILSSGGHPNSNLMRDEVVKSLINVKCFID